MSIPVSFSYDGKKYSGVLSQVQGQGATSVYHLTIDNYYRAAGCVYLHLTTSGYLTGSMLNSLNILVVWSKNIL